VLAPSHILVVDDDPLILSMMRKVLQLEGHSVELAADGDEALASFRDRPADLVILDWMLPGRNGLEVCRSVRRESGVPILMLTARDGAQDTVLGLDCGADDYVVKPFNPDELLARVRALLRRAQLHQPEVLRFQDLEMTPGTREVTRAGQALELTAREFDLLELFLRHPRQVLSRELILQRVWAFDFLGESNLVDVRVKYLRDKLEAAGGSRLIQTIRGAGYALRA
jgi:two-component system response regulator MprA